MSLGGYKPFPSNAAISQIVEAINGRSRMSVFYNGFTRVIEPHAIGRCRNGNTLLRAWQVEGGSMSGRTSGWKLMTVAAVQVISETAGSFSFARPQYRRGDKAMISIFAEV